MLENVVNYFFDDPLRVLYFVGGGGGLWFWITQWRSRIRINARVVKRIMDTSTSPNLMLDLEFEVENHGGAPTSLKPEIEFTSYTVEKVRIKATFQTRETDRSLQPFVPKSFSARVELPASYISSWYHKYKLEVSKGFNKNIYFLNSSKRTISAWRYYLGCFMFRVFGYVPESNGA